MAKFRVKSKKTDNSHPSIKFALRRWLLSQFNNGISVLDVYGGKGLMFDAVWHGFEYTHTDGDALEWLKNIKSLPQNIFDVDPYASPYEALKIISSKATKKRIGIVCTDGQLRRAALMRTKVSGFLQKECEWPERDLSLLAAIYHQYPKYLRYVVRCVCAPYSIEKLAIKYGSGTWKQATCYYAAVLCR